MAMDKTTTRRMIGAIVLVLVAALVLAYLLKGKNNQAVPEKIHDVTTADSPILAFPGNENINGIAPSIDPNNPTDKAGLNIVPDAPLPNPNVQAKTVISGYAANTTSNAEQEQTPQIEKKKVEIAKSDEDKAAAEEKSKKDDLKKADVVKLDNKDKVSASEHKSRPKEEKSEPKLVNEKKLPKYSDEPKKEEPKKVEKPKVVEPATVKIDDENATPTTGYSIQLLATKKEVKANALQKLMSDEGYPTYVLAVVKGTDTLYRVRIGAYQEQDEAKAIQARMKRRYTKNTNVQNSLVVTN